LERIVGPVVATRATRVVQDSPPRQGIERADRVLDPGRVPATPRQPFVRSGLHCRRPFGFQQATHHDSQPAAGRRGEEGA